MRPASICAFFAVIRSAPGGSMSSSTARLAAACESRSATKNGFPFQAGSLNRRSFGSNPAGTVSLSLSHWVRVRGGTCASATARCSPTLNTCNGCHGAVETNTNFLHIAPRLPGQASELSPFLTGTVVPDPITGAPRTLNDLARRNADLKTLVCPPGN